MAGVVAQAVSDAGAAGVVLLGDESAEAGLALDWCRSAVGEESVWLVRPPARLGDLAAAVHALLEGSAAAPGAHSSLGAPSGAANRGRQAAAGGSPDSRDPANLHAEAQRLAGRVLAAERNALLANPANKTSLLLDDRMPPEPLLPLGDLYASQIAELAGGWTAGERVRDLAVAAGGIESLDRALCALLEERRDWDEALALLPESARGPLRLSLERGRFLRRRVGLVPKLSARTLGVDLFA